jgi:hypothetical protein
MAIKTLNKTSTLYKVGKMSSLLHGNKLNSDKSLLPETQCKEYLIGSFKKDGFEAQFGTPCTLQVGHSGNHSSQIYSEINQKVVQS